MFINLLDCSHRTFALFKSAVLAEILLLYTLIDLIVSNICNTSSGPNVIMSKPLLVISNVAEFHTDFNLSSNVLCVVLSSTVIIASPDISSINGVSTLISFCFFGFNTIHSFGKKW